MIKLFSLKQQKKDGERDVTGGTKRQSAAQLRIQKGVIVIDNKSTFATLPARSVLDFPETVPIDIDVFSALWMCVSPHFSSDINELNLPKTCQVDFPDPNDLLNFKLIISPDEEFYKGGRFMFSFKVGPGYPHDPPKVKCETMVYHPNIDLEGNVCLNILREDWKPVLTINSIVYGLQYLFLEPNPDDPLNKEAAEVLRSNRRMFEQNVNKSMRGGYVGSVYFERCLK